MACEKSEKTVLLFYGELQGDQKTEAFAHMKDCVFCSSLFINMESAAKLKFLTPSLETQNKILKYAYEKTFKRLSVLEKVFSLAFSCALVLSFFYPISSVTYGSASDLDSKLSGLENEMSAMKYDMLDNSYAQLDYKMSNISVKSLYEDLV